MVNARKDFFHYVNIKMCFSLLLLISLVLLHSPLLVVCNAYAYIFAIFPPFKVAQ
jgi:hypothetical protein